MYNSCHHDLTEECKAHAQPLLGIYSVIHGAFAGDTYEEELETERLL